MRSRRLLLLVACLFLFVTPALAHVPVFASTNDSPSTAYVVSDPTKSWSIYDRLGPGGVAYYELDLQAGDRLRVSVYTPVERGFTPSLVVASPALDADADVPDRVEIPDGYGRELFSGRRSGAEYEPFAPSSFYDTAGVDRTVEADGRYLLAVYAPSGAGPVGLAVGQEERFSPTEYVRVPVDLLRVHLWAGQSPLVVFGPLGIVLVVGLLMGRGHLPERGPRSVATALGIAGLLYLGTAAGTAVQMGVALSRSGLTPAALVTAVFVVVPTLLGAWLLRRATAEAFTLSPRLRVAVLAVGVLGFATWAGLLVGPTLALAVAVAPRTGFGV